ncbi:MAG: Holliday junction resolvase RuvX [Patescibacteria group bacterium]|jgi:putative Holliday junction resolvase
MKILAIDYGRAKVGLAVGETETQMTEPVAVVKTSQSIAQVLRLVKEAGIEKIVVGLPGGILDPEIKKYGKLLSKETKLPIDFIDETLSTQDAQKFLLETKKKRKFRQEMEDAFAAAIMLEFYLRR